MKYRIHAKTLFWVGAIQSAVLFLMSLQAGGVTGIPVPEGSWASLCFILVGVAGAVTQYITANADPIDEAEPVC